MVIRENFKQCELDLWLVSLKHKMYNLIIQLIFIPLQLLFYGLKLCFILLLYIFLCLTAGRKQECIYKLLPGIFCFLQCYILYTYF